MRIGLQANAVFFVSALMLTTIVLAPRRVQAVGRNQEGLLDGRKSDPDAVIRGCAKLLVSADEGQQDKVRPQDGAGPRAARLTLAFYDCGNAYFTKGDFDRAIEDYSHALKISPQFTFAFNNRGNAYLAKRDYDRAIQDFNQAIRTSPGFVTGDDTPTHFDDAIIFGNRGTAYADKHDYDRAIEDYSQAIRRKPHDADTFYKRGLAHGAKGDYDKAIADYDQALQIDPEDAYALYSRGIAKRGKDDIAGAQADQAAALKINPNIGDKAGVREVPVPATGTDSSQTQFVLDCTALPDGAAVIAQVPPYIDEPIDILKTMVPALNGIDASGDGKTGDSGATGRGQDESAFILGKTGAVIASLLHNMPNLIAREEVRQPAASQDTSRDGMRYSADVVRSGVNGIPTSLSPRNYDNETPAGQSAGDYDSHVFTYRIVNGQNASGDYGIKEFRTGADDRPINYSARNIRRPLNTGFATLWLFFFPGNLQESRFRYLGQQRLGDRETYVLAFAQISQKSGLDVLIDSSYGRCLAPLQGVAWIDKTTFQIVRMQTDLLNVLPDIQLNQLRSTVKYGPVKIHGLNRTLWLPDKVGISWRTALGNGEEFHLYSHYRLFEPSVTILPGFETVPQ